MKFLSLVLFGLLLYPRSVPHGPSQQQIPPFRKIQLSGFAQGTTWHINYFSRDSSVGQRTIDSIFLSIDSSLSIYKPYSLISRFNRSTTGCRVDSHFRNVVRKSLATYRDTKGVFDITVQPLVRAWGFGNKQIDHIPDSAEIKLLRGCIGSDKLLLSKGFLHKKTPCITIDVNGIAQGYTVDVLADFLLSKGINDFIVEVGGEIRVQGYRQPTHELMRIGIESPADNGSDQPFTQKVISTVRGAVTTSGSYRKFYENNGRKINHLIDPSTGYPVDNELVSVTVVANDAVTADAYDNALMVMGLKKALAFVDARKDLAAYFIYHKNGVTADTASKKFLEIFK